MSAILPRAERRRAIANGASSLLNVAPNLPKSRVLDGHSSSSKRAFGTDAQRAFEDLRKGAERVIRGS